MFSKKPAKKNEPAKDRVTLYITLGMVMFVLVTFVGFYFYAEAQKKNVPLPKMVDTVSVDNKVDKAIVINPELKNVPVIDIWEDFQCPVCKKFEDATGLTLDKAIAEKKVTARYHIVSFLGIESVLLANAAACSADEGKFKVFHNFLYKNQPATENSNFWGTDTILIAGKAVGLDSKEFTSCVKSGKYSKYVTYIQNDMVKHKINSTPTILINGKELDRATQYYDPIAFQAAIDKA